MMGVSHFTNLYFLSNKMKPIGIITDNSVQFPNNEFPGADLVRQIPLSISISKNNILDISCTEIVNLPNSINYRNHPIIIPPTPKQLLKYIIEYKKEFEELIILLPSNYLSPVYAQTIKSLEAISEKNKFHLIDSGTFSYGLGILICEVAHEIYNGSSYSVTANKIRFLISKIFGIFCCPNLSYMDNSNFLDSPQAIALDFIGTIPIFILEEGKFSSTAKVKKMKHYLPFFENFIDEFDQPQEIIAFNGNQSRSNELISFQSHCYEQFRSTLFSFQSMNLSTAAIIGPKALGVFVLDNQ
jgi:fatty acid-binding protein DegV